MVEEMEHVEVKSTKLSTKVLLLLYAIIVLVVLALILLIGLCTKGFGAWENTVCQTRECVRAAARITSYMDETVDPCHDFYQYACGGFVKNHELRPGQSTLTAHTILKDQLQIKMKNVLIESKPKKDEAKVLQQVRNYYRSCMDEAEIEKLGIQPLKDHVTSQGGWSVLDSAWNDAKFDLEERIVKEMKLGNSPLIFLFLASDRPVDPLVRTRFAPHVGQTSFGDGLQDKYKTEFESMAVRVAVALGGQETKVKPEIVKMIEFETELVKALSPSAERNIAANTKATTVGDFQKDFPDLGLDLLKIMKSVFPVQITVKTDFINMDRPYFAKLGALIKKTAKRTLAAHITWQGIYNLLTFADTKTRSLTAEVEQLISGKKETTPRYLFCNERVDGYFQEETTRMFADEYFKAGTADVHEMSDNLKAVFKDDVQYELDWLDEKGKIEAFLKLDSMNAWLAYPNELMDNNYLDEVTKRSDWKDIKPKQYFVNEVHLKGIAFTKSMELLGRRVNPRGQWSSISPVSMTAFYMPTTNSFYFPIAMLQPPFYDINGPRVINYAAVGAVMGHEIIHGFDGEGRRIDQNGRLRQWMDDTSMEIFNARAKCVEEQYSTITVKQIGLKVNGTLTLDENIADLGGFKLAWRAYGRWVKRNGQEKSLPGLDLTWEQIFLLSGAQQVCHLATPAVTAHLQKFDEHTPPAERLLGIITNFKDFGEKFKCKVGDRMNPKKKCEVW